MNRFTDKNNIANGGGSGIGRATAVAFAREGAKVVLADIVDKDGHETVSFIKAADGEAMYIAVDASKLSSIKSLEYSTFESFGLLDVYFGNAGIIDSFTICTFTSDGMWTRLIGANLSGNFVWRPCSVTASNQDQSQYRNDSRCRIDCRAGRWYCLHRIKARRGRTDQPARLRIRHLASGRERRGTRSHPHQYCA